MSKLSSFIPSDFLEPSKFITNMDKANSYCNDQYNKGMEIGKASHHISISVNDTWGSSGRDGGHTTSYEKLGYHAHTAALLRGFLDSHCPIHVYRYPESGRDGLDHSVITWDGSKHVINKY